MFEIVKKSLLDTVPFNEEQLLFFISKLQHRTISKQDFFVREGQICRDMAIVYKGCFRLFFSYEDREQTGDFMFEGQWIGDYESFLAKTPATNQVQALEDSDIFTLSYDDMQFLYNRHAIYERFGRMVAERIFLRALNLHRSLLMKTAEERYMELLKNRPHIFERLPQHYIASYLGIQAPSLSRIRSKLSSRH